MNEKEVSAQAKKIKDPATRAYIFALLKGYGAMALALSIVFRIMVTNYNSDIDYYKLSLAEKTLECERKDSVKKIELAEKDRLIKACADGSNKKDSAIFKIQDTRIHEYQERLNK